MTWFQRLPANSLITFRNVSWEEYEDLFNQVREASGLRISYDNGTLQVMMLSSEHESYMRFFHKLITGISLRLHLNIRSFGSVTMKKKPGKGNEPNACFYIQSAPLIGNRMDLDFAVDPPPDVTVEIDLHHDSISKLPIYSALGIHEVWRFDGSEVSIHVLEQGEYIIAAESSSLPMLTARVLTDCMTDLCERSELQALLAINERLKERLY